MMLVFVDESYHPKDNLVAKTTFCAVAIEESMYREFDMKLFDLKKHFWKIQEPCETEIKGRLLLSERAITLPKNRDFASQVITLCKEVRAVPFAVIQDGSFTLASDEYKLPNLYRGLMRRVNTFMEDKFPQGHATFFFDSIDHQSNRKIALCFNNYMYRHHWGQSYKNIVPTGFFCDSEVSPGIQVADLLAYCANQRYAGRRGYLEDLFQEFRKLSYNHQDPDEDFTLWGFSMVKSDEPSLPFPTVEVTTVTERIVLEVEQARVKMTETGGHE